MQQYLEHLIGLIDTNRFTMSVDGHIFQPIDSELCIRSAKRTLAVTTNYTKSAPVYPGARGKVAATAAAAVGKIVVHMNAGSFVSSMAIK